MRLNVPFFVTALVLFSISAHAGIKIDYVCTVKTETVGYGLPNDEAKGSTRFMQLELNNVFKSYATVDENKAPITKRNRDGSIEAVRAPVVCGMLEEVYGCQEKPASSIYISAELMRNGRGTVRSIHSPMKDWTNVTELDCQQVGR